MLIKWNKENVKTITLLPVHGKPVPKKGHYALLKGVNEIPDSDWDLMQVHFKDSLERGDMEVLEAKTQPAPGKPAQVAKKLSELAANKAIALVKETVSPFTLNSWLGDPSLSDAVRLHVEERIKELEIARDPIEPSDEVPPVFEAPANAAANKDKGGKGGKGGKAADGDSDNE